MQQDGINKGKVVRASTSESSATTPKPSTQQARLTSLRSIQNKQAINQSSQQASTQTNPVLGRFAWKKQAEPRCRSDQASIRGPGYRIFRSENGPGRRLGRSFPVPAGGSPYRKDFILFYFSFFFSCGRNTSKVYIFKAVKSRGRTW